MYIVIKADECISAVPILRSQHVRLQYQFAGETVHWLSLSPVTLPTPWMNDTKGIQSKLLRINKLF